MGLSSRTIPGEGLGSLGGCLVEGDADERRGERRVRRRSLIISILVQTAAAAVLILLPLFGRTERIALAIATPIPPYGHPPERSVGASKPGVGRRSIDPYVSPSPTARALPPVNRGEVSDAPPDLTGGGEQASGPECSWCISIGARDSGPRPPQPAVEPRAKPQLIRMTTIDPAMLIYRVEPIYPPLAKQIHKEGRVELRARISTDGSIEALEVVGGDPLFFSSALEAVRQWRYKPTILNGQPVEIDTHITVIYTMSH
jgi:periplasmic protein TonB